MNINLRMAFATSVAAVVMVGGVRTPSPPAVPQSVAAVQERLFTIPMWRVQEHAEVSRNAFVSRTVPFNPVIALLAPTPFRTTRRILLGLKRRADALTRRRRGHHRSPGTQAPQGAVMARQSWHSFVKHLPRLGSVSGVCLMGYAIARHAPSFVRPALVLFVVSAVSACAIYWKHERIEDARREESLFVSLALSVMLGVISLTWLVMYRSTDLPLDVAWFGLTIALFVAGFQRAT